MTPSPTCEALIKGFESCRLVTFKPTPNDVWTIGWGHTGGGVYPGLTISQAQADALFTADLASFAMGVTHAINAAPTTQAQFDAMVSFAYNEGIEALAESTLLRKHRAGDYTGAKAEFARWDKQGDLILKGLDRRRAAEAALYAS
jgi:lysozyme